MDSIFGGLILVKVFMHYNSRMAIKTIKLETNCTKLYLLENSICKVLLSKFLLYCANIFIIK